MPADSKPIIEITLHREVGVLARVALEAGEYVFGQDASCEFSVNLPMVAARHARLKVSLASIVWEDLENGSVAERSVASGDVEAEFFEARFGPLVVTMRSLLGA